MYAESWSLKGVTVEVLMADLNLWQKLPNWLTYIRLGLIPIFVLLMLDPSRLMVDLATLVFIIAALTDYIDGYVARRFGAISDFGKLLDPLADKILVMAALIMLVAQRSDVFSEPWVPGWMVVLVLSREIWVTGLRGVAASQGKIVAASNSGKYKSALQMISIFCLLMHDRGFLWLGLNISYQIVGLNLLALSIAISYWGAVAYTYEVLVVDQSK